MLFLDIHVLQQCMVLCWHFTPHKHGNIFPKYLPFQRHVGKADGKCHRWLAASQCPSASSFCLLPLTDVHQSHFWRWSVGFQNITLGQKGKYSSCFIIFLCEIISWSGSFPTTWVLVFPWQAVRDLRNVFPCCLTYLLFHLTGSVSVLVTSSLSFSSDLQQWASMEICTALA